MKVDMPLNKENQTNQISFLLYHSLHNPIVAIAKVANFSVINGTLKFALGM